MQIRLDKYLADMGIGTRSQVRRHIRQKQVLVNGSLPNGPEQKVDTGTDAVTFQGKRVAYAEHIYLMLYKPQGCVSATEDKLHKTVLDLIADGRKKGMFPVGRLDLDTEGLLLVTDDGELAHNLLAPGKHVPKAYYAKVSGKVSEEDAALFQRGVDIGEDSLTRPAKLEILSVGELDGRWVSEVELTITEGKYHQVKRMFQAVGKNVLYLKRNAMGGLKLDDSLKPGEYRELTEEELQALKE